MGNKHLLFGIILVLAVSKLTLQTHAQTDTAPQRYEVGNPTLLTLWVDPQNGSNDNNGTSSTNAFQTLDAAWRSIPMGEELTQGIEIKLAAGTYTPEMVPVYWESRYGTADAPILISPAEEGTEVILPAVNIYDTRYLYFQGITVQAGGGDIFHCERCDHILLSGMTIIGAEPETYNVQEVVKFNQSTHIYIEDSDISGGWDNAVDFVGVQNGHVMGNTIHNAGDWCLYLKGGSDNFIVYQNEFYDCGTGGFSAGQGTGFEYMVPPFLQYEASNIIFINNVVHDVEGAGAGVNGGQNIVIAFNTFYNIGARSHVFEAVFGLRTCDGNTERCADYLAQGGWGTTMVGGEEPIPNQNVSVLNNVFYNPPGTQSQWQHFAIYAPRTPSEESNIPSPARTDDGLVIAGNVVWNGSVEHPLGIEDNAGCQVENPTCNAEQLLRDNSINSIEPQLGDVAIGNYSLLAGQNFSVVPLPDGLWTIEATQPGVYSD